jgi:GMP synthase-like glutamine amidotransferase
MNVLIIDNGSLHTVELAACFPAHQVKVFTYSTHSRLDREWADLFVLSGGAMSVLSRRYFQRELTLIMETQKPLIGICLGFELLAEAYGAKLEKQPAKIQGIKEIELTKPEYFGLQSPRVCRVYEAHYWTVIEQGTFEVLGVSSRGTEIIKHPIRPLLGFQFHPEVVSPANDGRLLLDRAVERLFA